MSDILTHKTVREHVRNHDNAMRRGRPEWSLIKASYTTQYWSHLQGDEHGTKGTAKSGEQDFEIKVEVNRLWTFVSNYLAALYPRANRAILSPDLTGNGDAESAQLTVNQLLSSKRVHHRVLSAIRQAILYPGSGIQVGYSPGRGSPIDRVWFRVIPWWEMLLDSDVSDPEDERFRGRIYYRLIRDVARDYGIEETELSGSERVDFLRSTSFGDATPKNTSSNRATESDTKAFVRVLELANLVDTWKDPESGIEYPGRLDVYVLSQGQKFKEPIFTGPLPFAKVSGEPLPHILPLIFNSEPEFPLKGLPHASRLMPQIKELNSYRSLLAMMTRKDVRAWLVRDGHLGSEHLTNLCQGRDGLMIPVPESYTGPLDDLITPVKNAPISSNIPMYMKNVEADLEMTIGGSPNARGTVTKATAFEVQTVQQYTESDFGLHAELKDEWLANVVKVALRALIGAMQDHGSHDGAMKEGADLASVGGVPDSGEIEGDEEAAVAADASGATADPYVDEDLAPPTGLDILGGEGEPDVQLVAESVHLEWRGDIIEVTIEDLDAEFGITFVEGGRTPLNDVAMQQNLMGLLQNYMGLWQAAQEPGPGAVFARAYMKTVADRFDLPRDLHPDELFAQLRSEPEPEPPAPGPGAAPGGPAGPPGPPAPAPEAPPPAAPEGPPLQLTELPPEEALAVLEEAAMEEGNQELLETIRRIKTLPPEQQAEIVGKLVSDMGAV